MRGTTQEVKGYRQDTIHDPSQVEAEIAAITAQAASKTSQAEAETAAQTQAANAAARIEETEKRLDALIQKLS